MVFGTLTTLDDLENEAQTVAQFGEETLTDRVNRAMAIHNAAMQEALANFAVITSDPLHPYGSGDDVELQELDQMGSPDVQKNTAAGNLGLPLRFFGIATQWNRHFMLNTQVGELLRRLNMRAAADKRNVTRALRIALTNPTNNLNYIDRLQTGLTLPLRALLNNDGSTAIPVGPNGEVFTGSHQHYLANATLTEAFLNSLVDTTLEHGIEDSVTIFINRAQEATVRGFTASFTPYVDARIAPGSAITTAQSGSLDVVNPTDRAIGLFSGAEVWVKPWVPANYEIVFDSSPGSEKALGVRTRGGSLDGDAYSGGFGILYEDDLHPLRANAVGREFGVGVLMRHKAAVGFSNGGAYVAPAFS